MTHVSASVSLTQIFTIQNNKILGQPEFCAENLGKYIKQLSLYQFV